MMDGWARKEEEKFWLSRSLGWPNPLKTVAAGCRRRRRVISLATFQVFLRVLVWLWSLKMKAEAEAKAELTS